MLNRLVAIDSTLSILRCGPPILGARTVLRCLTSTRSQAGCFLIALHQPAIVFFFLNICACGLAISSASVLDLLAAIGSTPRIVLRSLSTTMPRESRLLVSVHQHAIVCFILNTASVVCQSPARESESLGLRYLCEPTRGLSLLSDHPELQHRSYIRLDTVCVVEVGHGMTWAVLPPRGCSDLTLSFSGPAARA